MELVNLKVNPVNLVKLGNQLFELDLTEERILVHKYSVENQKGKYLCNYNLHACILSETAKNKSFTSCSISKSNRCSFVCFYSAYPADKLNDEYKQFLQCYCGTNTVVMCDETLLMVPTYPSFAFNAAHFLIESILKSHTTAVIAPKKWIAGVKKHFVKIYHFIESDIKN